MHCLWSDVIKLSNVMLFKFKIKKHGKNFVNWSAISPKLKSKLIIYKLEDEKAKKKKKNKCYTPE